MFPKTPYIFLSPAEAVSWGVSIFKRDGLSNVWGANVFPVFLRYVFVITIHHEAASSSPQSMLPHIENFFFSDTQFFEIKENSPLISSGYQRCSDDLFTYCTQRMKSVQDYLTSSNSIYMSNYVSWESLEYSW